MVKNKTKYLSFKKFFKNSKAFTIIELLIVIAIIGILASIIFASLDKARDKASDTAIKANLEGIKASAANYFALNNNYGAINGGTCDTSDLFTHPPIAEALVAADNLSVGSPLCAFGDATQQGIIADSWAVSILLKTDSTKAWCVDSRGNSKIGNESIDPNDFTAYCA